MFYELIKIYASVYISNVFRICKPNSTLLVRVCLLLDTDKLSHLLPEALGRCCDGVLVSVNDRTLPSEINLMGSEPAGLLVNLPEDEKTGRNELHGVVLEEQLGAPWLERLVAVAHNNAELEDKTNVSAVWLEATIVRHLSSVDALSLTGAVVVDEGYSHYEVVDKTTSSHESNEPVENLGGTAAALKEGKHGEQHNHTETPDRNTRGGCLSQESRSTTLKSETVERSSGTVSVCVTS